MRIVGGKWKGVQLESPPDRAVTRPTTDRVREAIASMVLSARGLDLSDDRVLDAFAGSGALGMELLSRGAISCTFTDSDRKTCERIKRNVKTLGANSECYRVLCVDVFKHPHMSNVGPFSLVLLDPPYATSIDKLISFIETLNDDGMLMSNTLIVHEHAQTTSTVVFKGATLITSKRYGGTVVDLHKLGASNG